MKKFNEFIWETHGIHAGTEQDYVKHGIDRLEGLHIYFVPLASFQTARQFLLLYSYT